MLRRSLPTRRRLTALALGVLVLGGQLGSLAHVALVKHVVCSAHGDLVHADGLEAKAARAAASDQTGLDTGGPAEGHRHQHCALTTVRRETSLSASATRGFSLAPRGEAPLPLAPTPRTSSLKLLHVAPKLSPPV